MKSLLICTIYSFLFLFFSKNVIAQIPQLEILTSGAKTSIRGLSVVNENVVWVSGSNGTVGRSSNGGKNWKWFVVKGFEKNDFRDIEAFDATSAIIMGVGEPAYILKTNDGGETWKVVFENNTKGMFLDAMEFWNDKSGIVIGDPINGKFFVARTFDTGNTWIEIPENNLPKAQAGEALFAASGTNIRALDRDEAVFVTGGVKARMFYRDQIIDLPIIQGKETTGANSISVLDRNKIKGGKTMIVVGGDFMDDSSSIQNCFYSKDGGKSWQRPDKPPHGYRSCVEYLSKKEIVTCGLTGVDYSIDAGKNWSLISKEGFHVVRISKKGQSVFLAGSNGKIGRLKWK